MTDQTGIFLLAAVSLVVWLWWTLSKRSDAAARVIDRVCADARVQRLDQSLFLSGIRFDPARSEVYWRFRFEFSVGGYDRHRGEVEVRRSTLCWARLDHPEGTLYLDSTSASRTTH